MQFADPVLIILGIAAVANLVMLIAVLRIRGLRTGIINENVTQILLLAYVFVSLGWAVIQGLYRLQDLKLIVGFDLYALSRISVYVLIGLAVLFYELTHVFQRKISLGWFDWAGGVLVLGAGIVLYENPFYLRDILAYIPGGKFVIMRWLVAFAILVVGWGLFSGSSILLTRRDFRETISPLHRNRIKYWSIAVCLTIVGQGLYLARLPFIGNLLFLLGEGIVVYVLMTHNLPDLRMAFRRSGSYLIMLLLTVAVYTGGFFAIQLVSKNAPAFNPLLVGALLALALAVLFNPLLGIVQRFVSRLMTGAHYDPSQTLSEYSISISNILDMEMLATVVVGLISEAMEITHGALVIVRYETGQETPRDERALNKGNAEDDEAQEQDGSRYMLRSVSGVGKEMPEGQISAKNPVAYFLRHEHRPLLQYDIDLQPRFHIMEPAERQWLSDLHMDVFVPIYTKENWIGLLALGPKTSGDRYYDDDLVLLQTLADQTAVALENARLYDDLKQRNMDNERLNAELKKANAELARLDRAKSDFINIASHELRTPLTQVIGYNDILGEMIRGNDLQPAVGVQMVDSVRRAARRLEEIVETMFDVSKLDTKTLDLMRAPVSLSSVITVAIDTWSKGMEQRRQTISVRGLSNLPTIVADGKRLTQVFSHLIQNAIKSTPDGGQIRIAGRVVVMNETRANPVPLMTGAAAEARAALLSELADSTPNAPAGSAGEDGAAEASRAADSSRVVEAVLAPAGQDEPEIVNANPRKGGLGGDRYVEIIIADTGIGIAADDLERIFEKFYRVGNVLLHSTGDTKFKGAGPGLGLTIARGIVEAHGGRIWAESPGHDEEHCPGSKFHVLLPVRVVMTGQAKLKSS